jgi:hypothetical protein
MTAFLSEYLLHLFHWSWQTAVVGSVALAVVRGIPRSGMPAAWLPSRNTLQGARANFARRWPAPPPESRCGCGGPNQYGDHDPLVLPKSGITVMVSTYFHAGAGKNDPNGGARKALEGLGDGADR